MVGHVTMCEIMRSSSQTETSSMPRQSLTQIYTGLCVAAQGPILELSQDLIWQHSSKAYCGAAVATIRCLLIYHSLMHLQTLTRPLPQIHMLIYTSPLSMPKEATSLFPVRPMANPLPTHPYSTSSPQSPTSWTPPA